ncbi:MAG: hypothetical protein ACP5ON_01725 [Bacteroidota bacterium]
MINFEGVEKSLVAHARWLVVPRQARDDPASPSASCEGDLLCEGRGFPRWGWLGVRLRQIGNASFPGIASPAFGWVAMTEAGVVIARSGAEGATTKSDLGRSPWRTSRWQK